MKTKFLITILRCRGDHTVNCQSCDARDYCRELGGLDVSVEAANRLELLLDNLRRVEAELKDEKFLNSLLTNRLNKIVMDLRNTIHEQEIIDGI